MLYKALLRPLLFLRDPEKTHEQTLALLSRLSFLEKTLEQFFSIEDQRLQVRLNSLTFPNPVGLAGGFDKNAVAVKTLPGFGFGFIEIGAVTALPQRGNPKPRLYRLPKDRALINRLGFNNEGAEAIAGRLGAMRRNGHFPKIPLGINIGRSKIVETKDAVADFLSAFAKLYFHGDFFTLNVSSPNTPNLRDLQEKNLLKELLAAIQESNRALAKEARTKEKPILVKIAPDMEFSQVNEIIEVVESEKVAGIIATNATAFLRESLVSEMNEPGGLSGKPLRDKATSFIRHIYRESRGRLPIVGVGGIFTAEDAYDKIKAGATAVQIYTGFIYEGPAAVKRINRGLLRLMERDGFKRISEVVGAQAPACPRWI
ncbi:MAG: quinone-dependent dihydroorotate dehydrogenase [Deltaproteobacteria bacterium]|nr:quinone-dependent dihydroorotate dehydrogenase [Deltaproteobacteria bacterium]